MTASARKTIGEGAQIAPLMAAAQEALEQVDINRAVEALMQAISPELLGKISMSELWRSMELSQAVTRSFQLRMFPLETGNAAVPSFAEMILTDLHIWSVLLDENGDVYRDLFDGNKLKPCVKFIDVCIRQLRAVAVIHEIAAREGISEEHQSRLRNRCKIATPMSSAPLLLMPHGFKI